MDNLKHSIMVYWFNKISQVTVLQEFYYLQIQVHKELIEDAEIFLKTNGCKFFKDWNLLVVDETAAKTLQRVE